MPKKLQEKHQCVIEGDSRVTMTQNPHGAEGGLCRAGVAAPVQL